MRKYYLIAIFCFGVTSVYSQFTHKIKADSVRIYNDNCTAELILENATSNIKGFLFNRGNGRTEFRKGLIKLNDSSFVIGDDTLKLKPVFNGLLPGSVLFYDGIQINQDNDLFYWDNTNKRLGIGTKVPVSALDIPAMGNYPQMRVGAIEFQSQLVNNAWFGANVYYNGTGYIYRDNGPAGLFYFAGDEGQFRFMPSGTAGSYWQGPFYNGYTQVKINANGTVALGGQMNWAQGDFTGAGLISKANTVLIGQTADDGTNRLQVNGYVKANGYRIPAGTSLQFLKADGSVDVTSYLPAGDPRIPQWDQAYGWGNHASAGYLTSITSSMVTSALGYTPYNSSNPAGYITSSALANYLPLSGGTVTGQTIINSGTTMPLSLRTSSGGPWAIELYRSDAGFSSSVFNDNSRWHFEHRPSFAGNIAIDVGNYNTYSPTLTGGGASGTWNIHISGNASYASSAGSVAWGNVSGHPTALSQFTNDLPNYNNWQPLENQRLSTGNSPSFTNVYTDGWFRNYGNQGIYNQSYSNHFYANNSGYWNIAGSNGSWGGLVLRNHHEGAIKGYFYWDGSGTGLLTNEGNWAVRLNYGSGYTGGQLYGSWTGTISNALRADRANGNFYIDDDYGKSVVGAYDSYRYQGVFAMGDAYKLAQNGTTPGNLYGIAWTHENVNSNGYGHNQAKSGLGHQALFMMNGVTYTAIGSGIWTSGNITTTSYGTAAQWNDKATHRSEGTNFIDYSRYVYNNGAYSGSGWVEPSDLGVRYAQTANSATHANYLGGHYYDTYIGRFGNSYYQANTWLQFNGSYGLYWPHHGISGYSGTPHFYPNSGTTYGSFTMNGSKNGYAGIQLSEANGTVVGMYDGAGNGGTWDPSTGWHFYWHRGNQSMGIGGSSTASGYKIYVNGNGYVDGNITTTSYGTAAQWNDKATHRGEGTNFIDYSRYVYNNGAYSGSGWVEPSDLGVRYAHTANSAVIWYSQSHNGSYYLVNNWDGSRWNLTSNHGAAVRVGYADAAGSVGSVDWSSITNKPAVIHKVHTPGNYTSTPTIRGEASGSTDNIGIMGIGSYGSNYNVGVHAESINAGSTGIGVYGNSGNAPSSNYGIYGTAGGGAYNYAGYFNGGVYASGYYYISDRKLKSALKDEDVGTIEKIKKLRAVSYDYTSNLIPSLKLPDGKQHGFVAQELQLVFPDAVKTIRHPVFDQDNKKITGYEDLLGVDYQMLIPLLVKALQEQQEIIEKLEKRVEKQEKKIL